MAIRVHELAKEFKISTAALKKHLSDMGVVVKSHMSPLDDDVVKNIRSKFNEAAAAVKQRQKDINLYHRKVAEAERLKEEEKQIREHAAAERLAEKARKEKIPVFVEKKIKKKDLRTGGTKPGTRKTESGKYVKPEPTTKTPPSQPGKISDQKGAVDKKKKEFVDQGKHLT